MDKFLPKMYVKDVKSINYDKLKKLGIKLLLFDFDNTLVSKNTNLDLDDFFKKLSQDFEIIIISNTLHKYKLHNYSTKYNLKYIYASAKPFKLGFNKIKKITSIPSDKTCMIGDQLLTDIWGGNRNNYFTILVDPFENKELIFTKINRLIENKIFKKLNTKRGEYYE